MCAKEGGTKVFHTVALNNEEYAKLLNDNKQVDLPHIDRATPDEPFAYSVDVHYLVTGSLNVMKYVTRVIRTKDQVVLAEKVAFGRMGGDFPIGMGHESSYGCPRAQGNFFEKPFRRIN